MTKEEIKKVIFAQNEISKSLSFIQRDKIISSDKEQSDPFIQIVSGSGGAENPP